MENMENNDDCVCKLIDPVDYDGKEFSWEGKPFLKGRIRSFLHMPLNFGGVCTRLAETAEKAHALDAEGMWLVDENSLWGADLYVQTTKGVSGAENAAVDGRWIAKVFEGPYKDMRKWMPAMKEFMHSRGAGEGRILVFYTACPRCEKKFGKNYVVLFGQLN
jgi:hypothetical protein